MADIDSLSGKIDKLADCVDSLRASVEGVKGGFEALKSSIATAEKNVTELWQNVNKLFQTVLPAMANDIHRLELDLKDTKHDAQICNSRANEGIGFAERLSKEVEDLKKADRMHDAMIERGIGAWKVFAAIGGIAGAVGAIATVAAFFAGR